MTLLSVNVSDLVFYINRGNRYLI